MENLFKVAFSFSLKKKKQKVADKKATSKSPKKFGPLEVTSILIAILIAVSITITILGWQWKSIDIGSVLLIIEVCYLFLFSFGKVRVNEIAVIFFLGRPIKNITAGVYFAPAGLFKVRKLPGTEIQDELPTTPENIFRGEGDVPEEKFPPIRIKFGQPKDDSYENEKDLKDDPYNHSMVVEVIPIIKWRIIDPMVFFRKMGTIENCRRILAAKAEEIFGDDFSNITPARALLNLKVTGGRIQKELKTQTFNSGIKIIDAFIKPFNFSKDLNKSVLLVAESHQKALSTVIDAKAENRKRVQEGIGEASYLKDTLDSRASGEAQVKELILKAEAIGIRKIISEVGSGIIDIITEIKGGVE